MASSSKSSIKAETHYALSVTKVKSTNITQPTVGIVCHPVAVVNPCEKTHGCMVERIFFFVFFSNILGPLIESVYLRCIGQHVKLLMIITWDKTNTEIK